MLTVACVLRQGGRYSAAWVRKLRHGVARHLKQPHRFVALADGPPVEGVETIPLATAWPGWWSKIELFRPGLFSGPVLYIDLDSVIVGPLDGLARTTPGFTMCRDFIAPANKNSSVMAWLGDYSILWDVMCGNADMCQHYDAWPGGRVGDQAYTEDTLQAGGVTIDVFAPRLVASYRKQAITGPPPGASVVTFHGKDKPDTINSEWVARTWT